MPLHGLRRHYAKKEAEEHMEAQNALARGDMKAWHKHEGKAHRAGAHAHNGGLMHTDYMMAKENQAPIIIPNEMPIVVDESPIIVPTVVPTMSTRSMSMGVVPFGFEPLPPTMAPIEVVEQSLPPNTLIEAGDELEPTVIVEPMFVEEARTVVEYGVAAAPITMVEGIPMGMGMGMQQPVMGVTAAMASMSMQEMVQYGEPQWVGQTVTEF
jgi:hypothetical protein